MEIIVTYEEAEIDFDCSVYYLDVLICVLCVK